MVVANIGNRPVTLSNIHFALIDKEVERFEESEVWEYVDTYVNKVYSDIVFSEVLITINPEELRVTRLCIKIFFWASEYL